MPGKTSKLGRRWKEKGKLTLGVTGRTYALVRPTMRTLSTIKKYVNMSSAIKGMTVPRSCGQWLRCVETLRKELQKCDIVAKAMRKNNDSQACHCYNDNDLQSQAANKINNTSLAQAKTDSQAGYFEAWLIRTLLICKMRRNRVRRLALSDGVTVAQFQSMCPDQGMWVRHAMSRAGVIAVLENLGYDGPPELWTMWACLFHGVDASVLQTAGVLEKACHCLMVVFAQSNHAGQTAHQTLRR